MNVKYVQQIFLKFLIFLSQDNKMLILYIKNKKTNTGMGDCDSLWRPTSTFLDVSQPSISNYTRSPMFY